MSITATTTPGKTLLSPADHALVLIDYQSQMAFATKSIAPELLRNNAGLIARAAAERREAVQPPGAQAENREIFALGEVRTVGQHELDMVACLARRDALQASQRMMGSGHRHHRHRSQRDAFHAFDAGRERA